MVGIILTILVIAYLLAFFSPGLWYGNTFLQKKSSNTFIGASLSHDYTMQMTAIANGTEFLFTVDKTPVQYRVLHNDNAPWLQIYENNALVYEGTAVYDGNQYMLQDDNGNLLEIDTSGVILKRADSFPTCSQLVNWSLMETYDVRGNAVILYILIAAVALLCLNYVLSKVLHPVSYGSPTPQTMQKFAQRILCCIILILALLGFFVH